MRGSADVKDVGSVFYKGHPWASRSRSGQYSRIELTIVGVTRTDTHLCRVILIKKARGGPSRHGMEEDTAKRLSKNRTKEMSGMLRICKRDE